MQPRAHILIFDDDRNRCDELAAYFRDESFRVTVCEDENELRRVMEEESTNLVLMDMAAPSQSSFDLAGELRHRQGTGVIMLGNRDDLIDRIAGLEAGADDFVSQPFHNRELLARVHSVLRRCGHEYFDPWGGHDSSTDTDESVGFEGWTLDRSSGRLFSPEGQEIDLSPGELDILSILIENAGRPVSREQLANNGQAASADPAGRSVDVQIGRLRQKIEANPKHPTIVRTSRGIGYMFAAKVKTA